jgi:hypothetical protein
MKIHNRPYVIFGIFFLALGLLVFFSPQLDQAFAWWLHFSGVFGS